MSTFYSLKIIEKRKLTSEAVEVKFKIPEEFREEFEFSPGQYLTLRFMVDGEEYRRSYSICSEITNQETIHIGVKRVENGRISNLIHDSLKEGDSVDVLAPQGKFKAVIDTNHYKSYYLFAAGSGVTPIYSIVQSVLKKEQESIVYMMYGNTSQDSVLFKDELDQLEIQYPERFFIEHFLSKSLREWSDLWTSENQKWYKKGRIDQDQIVQFINQHPPYAQNTNYFICGPGKMIENTKNSLLQLDVENERIYVEYFGSKQSQKNLKGYPNAKLIAILRGEKIELDVKEGKTILRTLIDAGKEPPFSCEGGVCSTCACSLTKGEVHMKTNLSLEEEETKKGRILSCQSIPLTSSVEISFD